MIRIENLYMMLAYAWNRLDQAKLVDVSTLSQKDLPNLLARVLSSSVKHLLKRGLYKEYVETADEMTTLRGRIEAGESIKRGLFQRGKAFCRYDEYSLDVAHNQIIKATLLNLSRCDEVAKELRLELQKLRFGFGDVSDVALNTTTFRSASAHPHTAAYAFIIDVCRMAFQEMLPTQSAGRFRFRDFVRDEKKMWRVFQDFVCNFYRKELPEFSISASHVKWDITSEGAHEALFPSMQTDVSLRSKSRHIILDTKFTPHIFQENWGKKSLRSAHLYQISTYLDHQAVENVANGSPSPEGILLYPMAKDYVDAQYSIRGRRLTVATVDLQQPWESVRERLCEIVGRT
jgi:5-methylcytosine-specific restriction enzyme subunit McrC